MGVFFQPIFFFVGGEQGHGKTHLPYEPYEQQNDDMRDAPIIFLAEKLEI